MTTKTCTVCSTSFTSRNISRLYCSGKCNSVAFRLAHRVQKNKTCGFCDVVFKASKFHNGLQKYCKEECRLSAKKIRLGVKIKEYKKKWKSNNKGTVNSHTAKRRAQKLNATPRWADMDKIKEIYKNCPEGYHVDHIVPLQGKEVSGLHVETNLQYLPALENIRKGNRN